MFTVEASYLYVHQSIFCDNVGWTFVVTIFQYACSVLGTTSLEIICDKPVCVCVECTDFIVKYICVELESVVKQKQ